MTNRRQRRAQRVRAPGGDRWLVPQLFLVVKADQYGRPTMLRACYDDEELGSMLDDAGMQDAKTATDPKKQAHFITVWVPEGGRFG